MQVNPEAQGLWYTVEPEEGDAINHRDDWFSLVAILWSVPPKMLVALCGKSLGTPVIGGDRHGDSA